MQIDKLEQLRTLNMILSSTDFILALFSSVQANLITHGRTINCHLSGSTEFDSQFAICNLQCYLYYCQIQCSVLLFQQPILNYDY